MGIIEKYLYIFHVSLLLISASPLIRSSYSITSSVGFQKQEGLFFFKLDMCQIDQKLSRL